ncbi:MAG TPA: ABC transporter ATP-binding protein [Fluviicola sp.]|nr:ABC transporter ATP-binding protein [Fluviicola sp.]
MKSLSYLNKYFYKYRWRLLLGVFFLIINNYFNAKIPVIIGQTTDEIKNGAASGQAIDTVFWSAIMFAGIVILFNIIKGFFLFLTRQTLIVMSRHIEFDLKNEIFQKYLSLDYSFYKQQRTGDLINRISEDVSQVRQYLGPGIMYTTNLLFLFPFNLYQMLNINMELTLYALIPLPIMAVLIYFVSNKMNQLSKETQAEQSRISTIGQESFSGIRVIKAYIQENHVKAKFNDSSNEYLKRKMKFVRINALFMPIITLLIGASTLLSIYIGGLYTFDQQITTGNILTFILIIYNLTWPFASVGWVTSIIQRAAASQERINEFLNVSPQIISTSNNDLKPLENITMNNVSFRYNEQTPFVLQNIHLSINAGQTIGIIGKTGSGKSTLLQLLVRQLDPTSGTVLYNDEDMKTIDLKSFRKNLSIVPQEVFLFSDSIKSNILFGKNTDSDFSEKEVIQVAKDAHVLHNIERFPDKFETLLGERGVNLSGGQKQRISIARALIRKPKLLLLDDCLSAVDTETEEIILRNLKQYSEIEKTSTVIVSHRISSLRNADIIYVLEDGKICEQGTQEELLQLNGIFKSMYDKQLQEEPKKVED